jgi:hypothetical protein
MKRFVIQVFLLYCCLFVYSRPAVPDDSLLGYFRFDGTLKEARGVIKKGQMQGVSPAADRSGEPGKAIRLELDYKKNKQSFISIPFDINPGTHPFLTITFWIQMNVTNLSCGILHQGERGWRKDEDYRGLFTGMEDGMLHWKACCGSDGSLTGPEVIGKSWTFVALVYDRDDQATRMVVNDRVYASPSKMRNGGKQLGIGPFPGQIDELRIYSRVLSLEELEALYGKPITRDTAEYAIARREDYKARMRKEEADKVEIASVWVVGDDKFPLHDSAGSHTVTGILSKGDTFRVAEKVKKYTLIESAQGTRGWVTISSVNDHCYPKGGSYLLFSVKAIFKTIFNFTNIRSWIIAVIFAVILFFAYRKYDKLDSFLNKIVRRDPLAQGASKSEGGSSGNILKKVFPLPKLRWWPLGTGVILTAVMFITLLIDGYEVEWFVNSGFHIIPAGYTRTIHWVLYITFMLSMLMFVVMVIESFVVVGPIMAVPRVIILSLLICMTVLVTYYLAIFIMIIVLIMLALYIFSSASSGSYKCPYCGRTFSSSAGRSGTCPHCGGSVRT